MHYGVADTSMACWPVKPTGNAGHTAGAELCTADALKLTRIRWPCRPAAGCDDRTCRPVSLALVLMPSC